MATKNAKDGHGDCRLSKGQASSVGERRVGVGGEAN